MIVGGWVSEDYFARGRRMGGMGLMSWWRGCVCMYVGKGARYEIYTMDREAREAKEGWKERRMRDVIPQNIHTYIHSHRAEQCSACGAQHVRSMYIHPYLPL